MSDEGERAVHHLENVISHWRQARHLRDESLRQLTISAPSYMNMIFVPHIVACRPNLRIRALEMPPPLIRACIAQNLFDLTLMLGKPALPHSWTCTPLGELRKALFASPTVAQRLAAPHPVSESMLRELPFISPVSNFNGQFVQLDDGCPLKYSERRLGHEVTTLVLAMELAASTEQLIFGPAIAAQRYVANGTLVEIPVEGWYVSEPLYLACSNERVLATDQRLIVAALSKGLAAHDPQLPIQGG
jgi:DNA-binding transcriptional LysR family regulator